MSHHPNQFDPFHIDRQHTGLSLNSFGANGSQFDGPDFLMRTAPVRQRSTGRSSILEENRSQVQPSVVGESVMDNDDIMLGLGTERMTALTFQRVRSCNEGTIAVPRHLPPMKIKNIFGPIITPTDIPNTGIGDFITDTMKTPSFGPGRSTFMPSGSIFGEKIDEVSVVPCPPSTGFDKLINFLVKFYRCESVEPHDYEFAKEDRSILQSFIKRKYKKTINSEWGNQRGVQTVRVHAPAGGLRGFETAGGKLQVHLQKVS